MGGAGFPRLAGSLGSGIRGGVCVGPLKPPEDDWRGWVPVIGVLLGLLVVALVLWG